MSNILYFLKDKDGNRIGDLRKTIAGSNSQLLHYTVFGSLKNSPLYMYRLYKYSQLLKEVTIHKVDLVKETFSFVAPVTKPTVLKKKKYLFPPFQGKNMPYKFLGVYKDDVYVVVIEQHLLYSPSIRKYEVTPNFIYNVTKFTTDGKFMAMDTNLNLTFLKH